MTWIWSRSWRKKEPEPVINGPPPQRCLLISYVLHETIQKAAKLAKEYRKYRTVSSKTKNRPHIFKVKFRDLSLPTKLFFIQGRKRLPLKKLFQRQKRLPRKPLFQGRKRLPVPVPYKKTFVRDGNGCPRKNLFVLGTETAAPLASWLSHRSH